MEDFSNASIECSACGGSSFTADADGVPICDHCDMPYAPPDPSCPRCGNPYGPGARRCLSCGAVLARDCPICGALNPLMAHHCVVCGQTLEATDALFARLTTKTPEQIRRVREAGAKIKAEEESAARARSAKMWAEEARRRKEEEDARFKRDRQERLIVGLALGLVAVAVVIAIVMAIVATSGNPAPVF